MEMIAKTPPMGWNSWNTFMDQLDEKTLKEVGNQFNVTRERIRQLEMKALRKLRCPAKTATLKDYY